MADNIKDTGLFGAAGILIAILIIAGVLAAGFNIPSLRLPSMVSDRGTLIIKIMDKPVDLTRLNVTIDSLSILNSSEDWVNLELIGGNPIPFDLLELENVTKTLSETRIQAGNYTKIRMHVVRASATYIDGTVDELRVPPGHIDVLLKPHLVMKSEGSVTVIIDLEPDFSKIVISQSLNLKPVLKAMLP